MPHVCDYIEEPTSRSVTWEEIWDLKEISRGGPIVEVLNTLGRVSLFLSFIYFVYLFYD